MQFLILEHFFMQVLQQRHFLILTGFSIIDRVVVVCNSKLFVYRNEAGINQLFFFLRKVFDDQMHKRFDGMDFLCQQWACRILIHILGIFIVGNSNIHDIDTIDRRRVHANELTVDCLAATTIVFQALQGRDDKYLRIHFRKTKRKQLCREGFAIARRTEDNCVSICVNIRIEHINRNQRVVCTVCTNHNAIGVLHLKGDERIAGCNAGG